MKIITTNELLMALVPNVVTTVEGEQTLFEKISPELQAAEDWVARTFTGEDILDNIAADTTGTLWQRVAGIIVEDALHRAIPSLDLVLAAPRVPSSTARVYAACLPRHESSPDASAAMVAALRTGDRAAIAASFTNDLQDAATRLCPAIGDALSALREAGVRGVSMSGSGSAVFGLVSSELEGRAIAAELERAGFWARHARTVG